MTQELPPIEEEVKVHGRQLSTATAYDELINWSSRLTKEIPLFQRALSLANAKSIVEVGCGSGRHSIMFGEWGYQVLGIDSNPQNIARANARLEEAEPQLAESRGEVSFAQGEFGEVAKLVGPEKTEIIFCLGDTLPRVGSLTALREALADFANALRSNGVLVLEFTNHIHFSQQRIRYSTPAVFDTVEGTKVFLRLMEFPAANTIVDVDFITLTKGDDGEWKVQSEKSQEVFISPTGIARELLDAGFDVMETAGDYNGRELNQYEDERITVIARRRRYRPALAAISALPAMDPSPHTTPPEHVLRLMELRVSAAFVEAMVLPSADHLRVPAAAARNLLALLPGLGKQVCVSGKNRVFADEIVGTQSPHLLEHLCIELMCQEARLAGVPATRILTGETSWQHDSELMRVRIAYDDDLVALASLKQACKLLDWAYGLDTGDAGDKRPAPAPRDTVPDISAIVQELHTFRER